jgi:hypothetical protein
MKRNYPDGTDRNVILKDYKQYLRADVTNFSPQDTVRLKRIMNEACALYNKIEPTAFSYEIKLIKTHGKHYGNSVYYTRENTIMIPANELKTAITPLNDDILLQTLLHEIAHVYTRLNPHKQAALFNLIGFKRATTSGLLVNDSLYKRIFYNPDGIDLAWMMDFKADDGKIVQALPLIYSKYSAFNPEMPNFMDHMGWSYFEAQPTKSGLDIITIGSRQQSTLNTRELPTHFLQKFNTNYIVHPNEIIADNIKLLAFSQKDPRIIDNLSPEGRNLLLKIKAVMNLKE